jgi:hypothetical protein
MLPGDDLDPLVYVDRYVECEWNPATKDVEIKSHGRLQRNLHCAVLVVRGRALAPKPGEPLYVDVNRLLKELVSVLRRGPEAPRTWPPTAIEIPLELHTIANHIRVINGFAPEHLPDYWKLIKPLTEYLNQWETEWVIREIGFARGRLLHQP